MDVWKEDEVSGCWNWLRGKYDTGYGSINNVRAHRLVYEVLSGPIPEGYQLDHLCQNRGCVNPSHLEPVLPKENKQRRLRNKLNKMEADTARSLAKSGINHRIIAECFGVDRSAIVKIANGRCWTD